MSTTARWGSWFSFWSPGLAFYALFLLYPIALAVSGSLYQWRGLGDDAVFVGARHYAQLGRDPVFWRALLHNAALVAASVGIQVPVAFLFAWWLTRGWRGQGLLRTLFFVPMVMPTVAIALLWISIYDPHFGLLNGLLAALTGRAVTWGWLGESWTAMPAVVLAVSWRYVGFHLVILVAGIESVAQEYLEAARVEGASEWQVVRHVVLPLVRPALGVCVTLALVGSLKYFDIVYVMTGGDGPSPHGTELVATYLYKLAFREWRMGYGSAVAVCLLGITLGLSALLGWSRRGSAS